MRRVGGVGSRERFAVVVGAVYIYMYVVCVDVTTTLPLEERTQQQ